MTKSRASVISEELPVRQAGQRIRDLKKEKINLLFLLTKKMEILLL